MPSRQPDSVSTSLASSTVMTPSLPTFCIASAIIAPTSLSPLAEMVPTCATSSEVLIVRARASRSISRFRSIGFMPAATDLAPSRTIDWARTVAVVVPSPARPGRWSWRRPSAPSARPVLEPVLKLDLFGDGHAVLRDARGAEGLLDHDVQTWAERHLDGIGGECRRHGASCRARRSKLTTSSAAMWGSFKPTAGAGRGDGNAFDDAHDVALLHDEEILTVELHLGARNLPNRTRSPFLTSSVWTWPASIAAPGADGDEPSCGFSLADVG